MRALRHLASRPALSAALIAPLLLIACGKSEQAAPAAVAAAATPAASAASASLVHVEPVSAVAKAPGVDPMKASTLPPMPESARYVHAPTPAATTEVAQAGR